MRLRVDLTDEARVAFRKSCAEAGEEPLANLVDRLVETLGAGPHTDFNAFLREVETDALRHGVKLTAKRLKLLQTALARRDESAAPVLKKVHRVGKVEADPLRGRYEAMVNGKPCLVEYEPDSDLRDSEQVPLLEDGGIDAFFRREVLPHVPDAWIDEDATRIGYEINFNRYFYKPAPMRTLDEIRANILTLQQETEGLLEQIIAGVGTHV